MNAENPRPGLVIIRRLILAALAGLWLLWTGLLCVLGFVFRGHYESGPYWAFAIPAATVFPSTILTLVLFAGWLLLVWKKQLLSELPYLTLPLFASLAFVLCATALFWKAPQPLDSMKSNGHIYYLSRITDHAGSYFYVVYDCTTQWNCHELDLENTHCNGLGAYLDVGTQSTLEMEHHQLVIRDDGNEVCRIPPDVDWK
jgi:hypothetical protein